MRPTTVIILSILLAFLATGQALHEDNSDQNITHVVEESMVWENVELNSSSNDVHANRLTNILEAGVNFVGASMFEVAKWMVELGFNNPGWNYMVLMKLIIWLMILSIVLVAIPQIIPIAATIYLISYGVVLLFKRIKSKLSKEDYKK